MMSNIIIAALEDKLGWAPGNLDTDLIVRSLQQGDPEWAYAEIVADEDLVDAIAMIKDLWIDYTGPQSADYAELRLIREIAIAGPPYLSLGRSLFSGKPVSAENALGLAYGLQDVQSAGYAIVSDAPEQFISLLTGLGVPGDAISDYCEATRATESIDYSRHMVVILDYGLDMEQAAQDVLTFADDFMDGTLAGIILAGSRGFEDPYLLRHLEGGLLSSEVAYIRKPLAADILYATIHGFLERKLIR